jgi:CelD/BcsL family acetyltransferase involved in cellulose biosynthesis
MLALTEFPLRSAVCDAAEMARLVPEWHDLVERAAEDNAYYSPHFVLTALAHLEKRNVKFLTIWGDEKLLGLMPYVECFGVPGLAAAGKAWATPYTFTCTPLLDRQRINAAAETLVAGLSHIRKGEWQIPQMRLDGAVAKALCHALTVQALPHGAAKTFHRATLVAGESFEKHARSHMSSSLRKNLTKRRRKLEDLGSVEYRTAKTDSELSAAMDAFLDLENKGWKGKRGTAMACDANSTSFANALFGKGAQGICRADMLLFDGKAAAIVLTVKSGGTGFTIKNAYDEELASLSAGLLLEVDILKDYLANPWAEQLDSGTNGAHVIDGFWPGRIEMADVSFSLATRCAAQRLTAFQTRQRAEYEVKQYLRKVLKR